MKIKGYLCVLTALFTVSALTACGADSEQASEGKVSEAPTSSVTETESEAGSEPNDESMSESIDDSSIQGMTITVKTIAYKDEQLTFEYEGREYTLPLSRDDFVSDYYWPGGIKALSEQVINNRLGETVTAEMQVSEDITMIYQCDILNQNGMPFHAGMLDNNPEDIKRLRADPFAEEYFYTMTKIEGTKYEFSNINRTLSADLNDLNIYIKVIYPDSCFDVKFYGYLFEDGQFIIQSLALFDERVGNQQHYKELNNFDMPNFFGRVQSCDGETADILLTDGKTNITVPTYYCEDELTEGTEVMVRLDCGIELFGSGESRSFDYAVVIADPSLFNYDAHEFSTLAYATANEGTMGLYDYVFIDEVQP